MIGQLRRIAKTVRNNWSGGEGDAASLLAADLELIASNIESTKPAARVVTAAMSFPKVRLLDYGQFPLREEPYALYLHPPGQDLSELLDLAQEYKTVLEEIGAYATGSKVSRLNTLLSKYRPS